MGACLSDPECLDYSSLRLKRLLQNERLAPGPEVVFLAAAAVSLLRRQLALHPSAEGQQRQEAAGGASLWPGGVSAGGDSSLQLLISNNSVSRSQQICFIAAEKRRKTSEN